MTERRRDAAPKSEWVLMYRRGLGRQQIADLAGAAPATVGYHLGVARTLHPELQADHDAAAGPKPTQVTSRRLERMQQLVTVVQETGRYPSRNANDVSERTLAAWLQRRRAEARAGTPAPVFRAGLAVLPGWEGEPRAVADEARWQDVWRPWPRTGPLDGLAAPQGNGHG